jgi:hypothetical protein
VLTVKIEVLVAVPPGVVTLIVPVVAPVGTVTVICVPALFTVNPVALTLLNFTEVAPVRFVPVIATLVPTGPKVGVNDVIVGAASVTVKSEALVATPLGVATVILPVVAPVGTVAVICVEELTVNFAEVPLNATAVAPVKVVPVITTDVPRCRMRERTT